MCDTLKERESTQGQALCDRLVTVEEKVCRADKYNREIGKINRSSLASL